MSLSAPGLESLDLAGKRVLVRVDFNVPMDDAGAITDDTRIRAALPTIRHILEAGGKPVLLSHLGRPKGQVVEALRLAPVGERLAELLRAPVLSLPESTGAAVDDAIRTISPGSVILLENVRFHPGETKGDPDLAREFAALGDVFVGDAFGAAHRAHASVSGIATHLPSGAGLLLQRELEAFSKVLDDPDRPLVAILGGAKVSDKLHVVDHLLEKVDSLLVGGGMAYTFLAAQGIGIGSSLCEHEHLELCRRALAKAAERGVELRLPLDHVVAERFAPDAPSRVVTEIPDGWMALDIGPLTREAYSATVAEAATVVWNGPMGVFEMDAFRKGTEAVGKALGRASGTTIVGGGDSVAAIHLLGLAGEVSHVSTGGGASLELLEGKALPGITALGTR